MKTPIGDELFQDIPRRVANFHQNRPRDVENLVDGKKITRPKYNSLPLSWATVKRWSICVTERVQLTNVGRQVVDETSYAVILHELLERRHK